MKKHIATTIILVLFLVLIYGCDTKSGIDNDNSAIVTHENATVTLNSAATNKPSFVLYELDNSSSEFRTAILENPIDEAYSEEFSLASTTQEMLQLEQKYLKIWEAELDSSVAKYISALSPEDAAAFIEIEKTFIQYVETSFAYDLQLLKQERYDIHLGSVSISLLYAEKAALIRDRTIYVKYMHYILEQAANSKEFSSLVFQ